MNTNQYVTLLTLLLQESEIANFEYWSEFILRIQRDNGASHPALKKMFGNLRIPPLFCLRLRGLWRIGERSEWDLNVQQFPLRGVAPTPSEAPMQAALLITKLGNKIRRIEVGDDCTLTLELSDGSSLTVQGIGGGWDESWMLELPVDDPDRDQWQIICESHGIIGGTIPGPNR